MIIIKKLAFKFKIQLTFWQNILYSIRIITNFNLNATMKICKLYNNSDNKQLCKEAIKCLNQDGVIALPTDTIYGIATFSTNTFGIERIYQIKNRNLFKPFAICVADIADILKWAKVTAPLKLLNQLLPGPVTIIFKRKPALNMHLNPGLELVGVRIPDNDFIRSICRQSMQPLALTSANLSNQESSLEINEFRELWPSLDLIFDGGIITGEEKMKSGSTVVDLSEEGEFSIVRHGCAFDETIKQLKSHGLKEKNLLIPH